MFAPHFGIILCARKDPGEAFDHEKASKEVDRRFTELAEKIVVRDWIKTPDPEKKAKAEDKIRHMLEFDERMKTIKSFVAIWNFWRDFYFELGPIAPKNRQQLTVIENCIEFASSHNLDLNLLIACVHRAFLKRKFRPNYTEIIINGTAIYEQHVDYVAADIDKKDYERHAHGF